MLRKIVPYASLALGALLLAYGIYRLRKRKALKAKEIKYAAFAFYYKEYDIPYKNISAQYAKIEEEFNNTIISNYKPLSWVGFYFDDPSKCTNPRSAIGFKLSIDQATKEIDDCMEALKFKKAVFKENTYICASMPFGQILSHIVSTCTCYLPVIMKSREDQYLKKYDTGVSYPYIEIVENNIFTVAFPCDMLNEYAISSYPKPSYTEEGKLNQQQLNSSILLAKQK